MSGSILQANNFTQVKNFNKVCFHCDNHSLLFTVNMNRDLWLLENLVLQKGLKLNRSSSLPFLNFVPTYIQNFKENMLVLAGVQNNAV
jgi:hypothetical protein